MTTAYDNVIGYEEVKAELMRFSDILEHPEKYRKLGVKLPRGILLHGVPGVGKTLMANTFIKATGWQQLTIRKDKPNGDFVDHIRKTFQKAKEKQPVVILLDDMDKFSEDCRYNNDSEEYVTIQSCIDSVKDDEVFCIATCNDIDSLPESLKRAGRFDKIIRMDTPEIEAASEIIGFYLKDKNTAMDINAEEIARLLEGHSCADLEMVINEAGIYAGYEGKEQIEQEDIIKACLRVIFDAPESIERSVNDMRDKYASVHEAGHVVIEEILNPGSVNVSSISRFTGEIGGVTCVRRQDNIGISAELQENSVIRNLGGKAAIEVVFGIPDPGAESDLDKAYETVTNFVAAYDFYSFDSRDCSSESDQWQKNRTYRVTCEMERYYRRAKKILIDNRQFLDAVAVALVEKQTITFREIAQIKEQLGINTEEAQ